MNTSEMRYEGKAAFYHWFMEPGDGIDYEVWRHMPAYTIRNTLTGEECVLDAMKFAKKMQPTEDAAGVKIPWKK